MKVGLTIDAEELQKRFGLAEKSIAYAAVNAVNATAKDVQKSEQDNVRSKFTLRKTDFMLRNAAVIKPFASVGQGRPYAEIAVGQKPRLLLSRFEEGGDRLPFVGRNVAVPVLGSPARPSKQSAVPDNLRITALGMRPQISGSARAQAKSLKGSTRAETRNMRRDFTKAAGAGQPWQGNQRTYMIPGVGVFQRSGPGKGDTRMLYKFLPKVELKPTLGFVRLAKERGNVLLKRNMDNAIAAELVRGRK